MDLPSMLDELCEQGHMLVDAARRAGCTAQVPSCPGWTVDKLLRHVGEVHRRAATVVGTSAQEDIDSRTVLGDLPPEEGLFDWVAAGHQRLLTTLRAAPADLNCWHFLPAPSPLAFWARRQLHETSVHRMDAELAAGGPPTAVSSEVAEDGIDELLSGFLPRRNSTLRSSQAVAVLIVPDDSPARWRVTISEDPPITERGDRPADVVFSGQIADLYAGLWNRAPITGDPDVVALWQTYVTVRWN